MRVALIAIGMASSLAATSAWADIKIGAVLSLTGPAASLGIPEKNTIDVLPREIGGEAVRYIVLDDASDPSNAVRAAKKLMDEEKVDVILGPSTTPNSLAIIETIAAGKTPTISMAGSAVIAKPVEGPKLWSFKLAPEEPAMAAYVYGQMKKDGKKTVAFIAFNDAFGDSFVGTFKKIAGETGIKVIADERYSRTDTSVTAQALQVIGSGADAVVIGASGTPGVTPVLELRSQGYTGAIFINQGMANPDVLRVGGAGLEGIMLAVAPALVAEQLPEDNPIKAEAVKYVKAYEGKYGPGTRSLFGATVWDAFRVIENAVPKAKQASAPGTEAFRTALRAAIEETKELVGAEGIFTLSPTDHNGTDLRAQVLVRVEKGAWRYVPLVVQK